MTGFLGIDNPAKLSYPERDERPLDKEQEETGWVF